jgi:hypothetical protein
MALFRTDYSGRGELSERQQKVAVLLLISGRRLTDVTHVKLAQMLSKLTKLSEEYNVCAFCRCRHVGNTHSNVQIAILMTNQVQCT